MLKQIFKKALPLLLGLALLGPLFLLKGSAHASNPATINFQGKIVNAADGTNIASPNGTYSIVFRIYNTSSPTMTTSCTSTSSCLWQETQSSVTLSNGIFQVELGSACALTSASCNNSAGGPINFANNNSLYLTMQFNGDTSGSNGGFMSPLIHITSVPFAFQSDNAASLGGIAAANYVQLAQGVQTDSTNNTSIFINKGSSATGNLLELQKNSTDILAVGNTGAVTSKSNSGSGFQIQDSSNSKIIFNVDTSGDVVDVGQVGSLAGEITFNSSSTGSVSIVAGSTSATLVLTLPTAAAGSNNQCIVSSTGGALSFLPCGAGNTATVGLSPEFQGAVMTPVSLTGWTNSGTMTSDFCSGSSRQNLNTAICTSATESHNYYSWTASSNCVNYDIWVRWAVPSDFSSFPSTGSSFNSWKTGNSTTCNGTSGNDDVVLNVYKPNQGANCASQSMTNTSGSWQNTVINLSGCTSLSPGDFLSLDIQLKVNTSGDFARIGEITLNYNRN